MYDTKRPLIKATLASYHGQCILAMNKISNPIFFFLMLHHHSQVYHSFPNIERVKLRKKHSQYHDHQNGLKFILLMTTWSRCFIHFYFKPFSSKPFLLVHIPLSTKYERDKINQTYNPQKPIEIIESSFIKIIR